MSCAKKCLHPMNYASSCYWPEVESGLEFIGKILVYISEVNIKSIGG
jgi:hypothetical protein